MIKHAYIANYQTEIIEFNKKYFQKVKESITF